MTLPSSCSLTVSDAVVHAAYNSDEDARKVFDFLGSQPAALPLPVEGVEYGTKLIAEAISHHFGEQPDIDAERDDEDTTLHDVWEAFDRLSALSTLAPSAEAAQPVAYIPQGDLERLAKGESVILYAQDRERVGVPLYAALAGGTAG
jgi:hypothetical protein